MAHVLVLDSDVRTARAIEDCLCARHHHCLIASSGLRALDTLASQAMDLAIIDVGAPGLGGLDLCRHLRHQFQPAELALLLLGARNTAEDRIAGLQAGADDYLGKPFEMRELELRVASLLRRIGRDGAAAGRPELSVGNLKLDPRTYQVIVEGRPVQLTPVEYSVLHYFMTRPGEVISAEQLLQDVWRYYPGTGDAAVVRMQIMNLRDKIENDRQQPRYVKTVYRHGYTLVP